MIELHYFYRTVAVFTIGRYICIWVYYIFTKLFTSKLLFLFVLNVSSSPVFKGENTTESRNHNRCGLVGRINGEYNYRHSLEEAPGPSMKE